ncbi:hypothetical protein [Nesterenkonia rhizosphaerae]|uniref:DUF4383 domain-containing protein n=1 Tax=Nesterenkonia rhizosphaerae TaxID=1348272 RepID=A0ABP9FSD9_9MICC
MTGARPGTGSAGTLKRSLLLVIARVAAGVSLAVLGVLFFSAGQMIQNFQGLDLHSASAVTLHISTGVFVLALILHSAVTKTGLWAAAGSAALFALTFLQAALGSYLTLTAHITGALVTVVLCTCLTAWIFTRPGVHVPASITGVTEPEDSSL